MSQANSKSTSNSSCGCSTGQTRAPSNCPKCQKTGMTINLVTLQNTLTKPARNQLNQQHRYYFCDNPDCHTVYYNEQDTSVFSTEQLKNRVTIKDESPQTPLCYCFKVLKKQALEEIARTGRTNVFQQIQNKMKPGQSCFCEKANPRGDTCSQDIMDWLKLRGISPNIEAPNPKQQERPNSQCSSGCCS